VPSNAPEAKCLEEEAEHIEDFVADFHVAQIGFFDEP
jgi:hypothetical protein